VRSRSLISYLPVCIGVAIGVGYISYRPSMFVSSVLSGLAASAFSAVVLVWLDRRAAVRLKKLGLQHKHYPSRVSVIAISKKRPEEVIAACMDAIRCLPNFAKILKFDREASICARTRWSRYSWGEDISVRVELIGGLTRIYLSSVPALFTVTEDMGFNFQNIALILRKLRESVGIRNLEPKEYEAELLGEVSGFSSGQYVD